MSDALVLAIGVAFSPVPITAVTLILGGTRPRAAGSSFALGWLFGVAASILVLIAVVATAETTDENPLWIAVSELAVGFAFLALAIHIWRGRRRRNDLPPWLGALDRLTPARSAALGLVLAAANPKNLALALGAAIALAESNVSSAVTARTAVLFILIGTAGVALPLAIYVATPDRARSALARFRAWLIRYDAVVLTALGILIGAKFLFDGAGDL